MKIEDKVERPLAELGVSDAAGVAPLFAELQNALESDKRRLVEMLAAHDPAYPQERERRRVAWLGRVHGIISRRISENWLRPSSRELKRAVGMGLNALRVRAESIFEGDVIETVVAAAGELSALSERRTRQDLTLPGYRRPLGSIHPVTRVRREIEDIFLDLGFSIQTGPEIESVYYNFDALNLPDSHPARDDWDTFYVDARTVLRTHTSPVQIRAMEKHGAPLYIIVPGKVYRHDNPDSSHATMFHQIEGLAVDTDITFADLKGTLDFFARKFFGGKIRTSFHPSFFPFTEPSGEVAISCVLCDGQGCRTCKDSGWVEVMGCGMVHPDVLRHGGVDPKRYSGWAFGLGVERFAMMKYGVDDIQLFSQSDVRFLEQF